MQPALVQNLLKKRTDAVPMTVDQLQNARATLVSAAALSGQSPLQVAVNSGLLQSAQIPSQLQASILSPSQLQLVQSTNGNIALMSPNALLARNLAAQMEVHGALLSPVSSVQVQGIQGVQGGQVVSKVSPPRQKTILPKVNVVNQSAQVKTTVSLTSATKAMLTTTAPTILSGQSMAQAIAQAQASLMNMQQPQHHQLLGCALSSQSQQASNSQWEAYEVPGGTIIIPKKGIVGAPTTTPGGVAATLSPQGGLSYLGTVPLLNQQAWPTLAPTIQLIQTANGQQAMVLNPFMAAPLIYPQISLQNLLLPTASLAAHLMQGQRGSSTPTMMNPMNGQGVHVISSPAVQKVMQQQMQKQQQQQQQQEHQQIQQQQTKMQTNLTTTMTMGSSAQPSTPLQNHCLQEKSSPSDVVSTTTQDLCEGNHRDDNSPHSHLDLSDQFSTTATRASSQNPSIATSERYPEPDSSTSELPLIERMGACSPLSLPPPQSPFSSSPSPSSSPCDQEDANAESILALLQKAANKIMVEVADSCTNDESPSLASIEAHCTPMDTPSSVPIQPPCSLSVPMSTHTSSMNTHSTPINTQVHLSHVHHHVQHMENAASMDVPQGDNHHGADQVMFPVVPPTPKTTTVNIDGPPDDRPYILYSVESTDGAYRNESHDIHSLWRDLLEKLQEARSGAHLDPLPVDVSDIDGYSFLGVRNALICHMIEQLPGADECLVYQAKYHKWRTLYRNPSGCARTEAFDGQRSDHDMFSWLTSYHRHPPKFAPPTPSHDVSHTSSRRHTALELPDAMRYRHLKETTKQVTGVFRSGIHGRGLYCKKDIAKGEMIIEYSGELIRSSLCDLREKLYESKGMGCYMFRMDNDDVVDATSNGNAARFINHSCDPNCYSKMITVDTKKHIVIYALREIRSGEELTYDYKFPIEDDKLACTCGSRRCRKFMN